MAHFSPLHRMGSALVAVTLALSTVGAGAADAATTTNAWQAKVGSSGANGTAKIVRYTAATGALTLKLAKLRASTILPVVVYKGSCGSVGAVLFKLASIKTTSSGAASRTSALTSAQLNLVLAATKGTGKIAIRIGTGSSIKCGVFAKLAVPAYVAATVPVGGYPVDVTFLGTTVWVATDESLVRIDPATNRVLSTVPVATPAGVLSFVEAVATGAGSLWVLIVAYSDPDFTYLPGSLLRIDPVSGAVLATIPVASGSTYLAGDATAIWVSSGSEGVLQRISPATNQIVASIPLPYPGPVVIATDGIWLASDFDAVSRIDPSTNQVVSTIATVDDIAGLVTTPGAVWVTHGGTLGQPNGSMSRIDPVTRLTVAIILLGIGPGDVAAYGPNVWVAMDGEPVVIRVNVATNAIVKIPVAEVSAAMAADGQGVWVVPAFSTVDNPVPDSVTRINY